LLRRCASCWDGLSAKRLDIPVVIRTIRNLEEAS
jgi:hypothetical protein